MQSLHQKLARTPAWRLFEIVPLGTRDDYRQLFEDFGIGANEIAVVDQKFEELEKLRDRDAANYEQARMRFIERFRAGQADLYGYKQIVGGFFGGDEVEGRVMTQAHEQYLTPEDRAAICRKVIEATGFTEDEARRLEAEADERRRQSSEKSGLFFIING